MTDRAIHELHTAWPTWVNLKTKKNKNPRKNTSGYKYEQAEALEMQLNAEAPEKHESV